MKKGQNNLNYTGYCRKSSESEDRQILSIPAQNDELNTIAKNANLKLVDIRSESKSAKSVGRPVFNELLDEIKKGKIQGIVCWHPDRLSRNVIDTAQLIDLMDKNKLIEIVTPGQIFRNTPMDKFMFNLMCGQAKLENDNKGINVKRGMEKKAKMGIYPGSIPVGYRSVVREKGNRKIESDADKLKLLRKAFDLLLTGRHSVMEVRNKLNNEWGFKMKNGKGVSRSAMYHICANPFYMGKYQYPRKDGPWFDGAHEAIISPQEYDTLQIILGNKGRPRPKSQVFDFTGLLKCGECGGNITAETKVKRQKNGNVHSYVYYHCTKRVHPECSQKCVEGRQVTESIMANIESIQIPPEFHLFALKWIKKENVKVYESNDAVIRSQEKAYTACLKKIENLTNMRAEQEIDSEEYARLKAIEIEKKNQFEKARIDSERGVTNWVERTEDLFSFIEGCKSRFINGDRSTKREILSTLGSNLLILDKKLNVCLTESLLPIQKVAPVVKEIKDRLEPINNVVNQEDFEAKCLQNPIVLRTWEDVRKSIML